MRRRNTPENDLVEIVYPKDAKSVKIAREHTEGTEIAVWDIKKCMALMALGSILATEFLSIIYFHQNVSLGRDLLIAGGATVLGGIIGFIRNMRIS